MSNKLFVGNLPWAVDDEGLKELFTPHGKIVSAKVIFDRKTNRSKGFGFVEMESKPEAEAAVKALNGSALNGRNIIVNVARNNS